MSEGPASEGRAVRLAVPEGAVPEGRAVLLVGHGAPARDAPPELVRRFKALEAQRRAAQAPPSPEEIEVDRKLRHWPRDASNDPYREGLLRLAEHLRPLLGGNPLALAFNEFCAPSIAEAFAELVDAGAREIVVVPSMLTPGGIHSEIEIPEELAALRERYPALRIHYAWPFDLDAVAGLLAAQVAAATASEPS
ncbi:MAG: CbiX/SirB N-terminal domain-containing protein [Polyangiaceae bacterium]|nr:CbiX/SirB N-terminal domain-containing protein [Polyangiaceae bacterium]